jgi:hypothetical protein
MARTPKILCVAWLCALACAACDPSDPAPPAPDPAEGEGTGGPSPGGTTVRSPSRDAGADGAVAEAGVDPGDAGTTDAGALTDAGSTLDAGGSFGAFNDASLGLLDVGVLPQGASDAAAGEAGEAGGPRDARAEGGG